MDESTPSDFRSGFVAIAGPPNVGKSTLLNHLLGRKVAIVSPKPQTTRNRIIGVYHEHGHQIVFVDTPGVHPSRTPLHQSMVESAQTALSEVDIVLLMIELPRHDDPNVSLLLRKLKPAGTPAFLLINKIDKVPREHVLPVMEFYRHLHPFEAMIPISALKGDGVARLLDELRARLAPGPMFFPAHMTTDQSESFLISELIREKIYLHTRRELPYATAVTVERIEKIPDKDLIRITARIHVEKNSQKLILVGSGGGMIKSIGRSARIELEKTFESRIYLDLTVRIEKNWSKDTRALRRLGY